MLLRTTGLCSARFCFFAIAKPHSFLRSLLAFGSSPVTRIYLARVKIEIADNRILPFPVDGSPSARFRKRNVTELVLRLAMRTTGPCSARFHFSSCTFFANKFTHSNFAMLAIADGVANSRFIGCLVALFFLQVLPPATMRLPTRSSPVFLSRNQTKRERLYLSLFVWCGQQDLNLHEKCLIRSLVLCVCQFRHVRFLIPIKPRLPRNLTDIARL